MPLGRKGALEVTPHAHRYRKEQDNGVIGKPEFLQFAENRAHAVVGALDHGRIGRVLMSLGRFLGFVLFFALAWPESEYNE